MLAALANWRNRLIASPRFQRWASGFVLTRPVAQRRAMALVDLCAGFVYSQTLFACVQLDLFNILQPGPLAPGILAARLSLPVGAAERLLDAACALGLLRRHKGGGYGLDDLGAAMLGNPGIAAMVAHHAMLYRDLADPVALLRGTHAPTELSRYWPYATAAAAGDAAPDDVAGYSTLMSTSQALVAGDILDACPLADRACLMDVGGGEGTFLKAAGARHPALQLLLFDLPAVADRATEVFAQAGLAARAKTFGGDFAADALPQGADAISLVRVVHDHDDAKVMTLLRACARALPPYGLLLLAEPMAGTRGAEAVGDVYFGFYLLAMGSGRARTPQRLAEMLRDAGFDRVRQVPTRRPFLTGLVVAQMADTSRR